MALVEALPFTYLHVFSYSDRRGTEAARRPGGARDRRDDPAAHAPASGGSAPRSTSVSAGPRQVASCTVLVLEQRDRESGHLVGLTDNYLEVAFPGPHRAHARSSRAFARPRPGGGATGGGPHRRWVSRGSASSGAAGSTSWRV